MENNEIIDDQNNINNINLNQNPNNMSSQYNNINSPDNPNTLINNSPLSPDSQDDQYNRSEQFPSSQVQIQNNQNQIYNQNIENIIQNLQEEMQEEELILENEEDESSYENNISNNNSIYDNNNQSSNSSSNLYNDNEDDGNDNSNNNNNNQETSTVNSNDICLDTSFYNDIDFNSNEGSGNLNDKKENSKSPKRDTNNKKLNIYHNHNRCSSAPLKLLNEFEEFKYSIQYENLERAFFYANKLILNRIEGKFDIESEYGNDICMKFLKQIETLIICFNVEWTNRDYRKNFSKAYIDLFDKNSLCYLIEILDSAQESTRYLFVNGEKFTFSQKVLDYGNQLFSAFCCLIMVLTESVNKIKEEIFYEGIKELKSEICRILSDFDKKWTLYEEQYISELIEIEKQSRRFILDGIKLEKEISKFEMRANIRGQSILHNNKEYNELRKKFVELINVLNKIANIDGKGRDDLTFDILLKAEKVLLTISEIKSRGMRNLAISINQSLTEMRNLFKKYEINIEGIDPQLQNNSELSDKLLDFETKWEKGKDYLLDIKKYNQLLFFSEMIEIVCEKYTHYSIYELIEDSDPSIFVSLPCILLLKAIDKEDEGICIDYIPGLNDITNDSGKLFKYIVDTKKYLVSVIKDDYVVYNLLEKLVLFNNTNDQFKIESEIEKYLTKENIKEFKNHLINLSMHLQRFRPSEWNTFFELAMDIK